jgi:hypothetical protein
VLVVLRFVHVEQRETVLNKLLDTLAQRCMLQVAE